MAQTDQLPADSTLRSVWKKLASPGEFIPKVFGVTHTAHRDFGAVQLRIGVTGAGKMPNYRVERASDNSVIAAYDGNNHQPWPDDALVKSGGTWSAAVMSYDEVRQLLADLRASERN